MTKRWLATQPTITLDRPPATNPIGTPHTVTATVTDGAHPGARACSVCFTGSPARQPVHLAARRQRRLRLRYDRRQAARPPAPTRARSPATDTITAFADTNNNCIQDNGEPTRHGDQDAGPPTARRRVSRSRRRRDRTSSGPQHCVYAQADRHSAAPAGERPIVLHGHGRQPAGRPLPTNSGGVAQFCYTGTQRGTDTITAFVDNDDNGTRDAASPSETVTKRWLATPAHDHARAAHRHQPDRHQPHRDRDRHRRRHPGGGRPGRVRRAVRQRQRNLSARRAPFGYRFVTTDASGQATCTYTGSVGGTDTIIAFADTNSSFGF